MVESGALFPVVLPIAAISFFLNLLWEVRHSTLYTTCHEMDFKNYVPLILKQSIKDALWISLFYLPSVLIFGTIFIFKNYSMLTFFVALSLTFSFIDERISIRKKRWEYAPSMPIFFGVGITPLFELVATGVITFFIVFQYVVI